MKKLCLLLGLGFSLTASAQQFVNPGNTPQKFSDVVAQYESTHPQEAKTQTGITDAVLGTMFLKEDVEKDYQFDRWKDYWQQHLDQNGYMVSPVKTWKEWLKARDKENSRNAERTASASASWTFMGPDSSDANGDGVGRLTLVAFHPTLPNTYLAGSPGGGVWRTTDNGNTWTCLTDQNPLLSVSDIKYNPLNPNTIYICTGDKDGDDYWSIGVFKSTDGGSTWNPTGLVFADSTMNLANSLLINPSDTNTLILGSTEGIYITHNAGASWVLTYPGYNFKQVLYHPVDTNIVYATSHWTSSNEAQIFRSADGGTTWNQVTTTFTDAYRITLAVTPANPAIVDAIVAASGSGNMYGLDNIYQSTDTGYNFSSIFTGGCGGSTNLLSFNADATGCGGQGFYDLTIAISPTNANDVYAGGVNAWHSTTGGTSWSLMNQWSDEEPGVIVVHADKHFMGFQPLVSGRFFECNDGGIYWTDNPAATGVWNDITNHLGIEEIYRVAVSPVANYVLSGAQDDGTKETEFGTFTEVLGGDGMECQIDPTDSNNGYVSSEYGNYYSYNISGGTYITGNIPGTPTGGWVTPLVILPSDHNSIFAGFQNVWESNDQGNTFYAVSGALTSSNLLRVVTSFTDPNTVYAADDNTYTNNLFYSHNINLAGSATWTTIVTPYTSSTSDIMVDRFDNTKVWVTFGGYGSPQVVSYSPSEGWTQFNTGLPDVPVNCIIIDSSNRIKYIGTDIGVYYMDTTMTSWLPFNTGMPVVRVTDLQINYYTGMLWASTYGRCLWETQKILSHPVSTSIIPLATDYLYIAPNPSNGNFQVLFGSEIAEKNVDANIINIDGKVVWQGNLAVKGNSIQFSNLNLSHGIYVLGLYGDNGVIGRKKIEIL